MIYRNGKYNNYGKKKRGAAEAKELPLKNVLQSWFDEHEIPADFNAGEIIAAWEDLTGDLVKKLTKKVFIENKTLYVYVNSPALKTELMMIRSELCEKLNDRLTGSRVKAIIIK